MSVQTDSKVAQSFPALNLGHDECLMMESHGRGAECSSLNTAESTFQADFRGAMVQLMNCHASLTCLPPSVRVLVKSWAASASAMLSGLQRGASCRETFSYISDQYLSTSTTCQGKPLWSCLRFAAILALCYVRTDNCAHCQ